MKPAQFAILACLLATQPAFARLELVCDGSKAECEKRKADIARANAAAKAEKAREEAEKARQDAADEALKKAMYRSVYGHDPAPPKPASAGDPGCKTRQSETLPLRVPSEYDTDWFLDKAEDKPLTDGVPDDRKAYCSQGDDDFSAQLDSDYNPVNRLAIDNPMGDYNTGLCWLHSIFQRNAVYLSDFRPKETKTKPQGPEAIYKLMRKIAEGKEVARIDGYSSIQEFTAANKGMLDQVLNEMGNCCAMASTERRLPYGPGWKSSCDGYPTMDCAKRVHDGGPSRNPQVQAEKMDALFDTFIGRHRILYARLKLEGWNFAKSHSVLITHMQRFPNNPMEPLQGYDLRVIDSNDAHGSQWIHYKVGQDAPRYTWFGTDKESPIELFPDMDHYMGRYDTARAAYCKPVKK